MRFIHHITSVLMARALILGPLDRCKTIMQVKDVANFLNKTSDLPKNNLDLYSKISINQGVAAFWRGTGALISKLSVQYSIKFASYDLIR